MNEEESGSPLLLPEPLVHLGGVGVDQTVTRPVQVVNRSGEPVGVRVELWTGAEDGFSLDRGCDTALEPGESCELGVSFAGASPGVRMGTVLISTHRGETVTLELVAEVVTPGKLVASESSFIFEDTGAGVGRASHRFVVRNSGGTAAGPLQITSAVDEAFLVEHDCPESLGAAASCNVDVTFAPKTAGPRNGFVIIDEAGARLYLGLHGVGLHQLTVTRIGQGTINAEGLTCDGTTCSGLYYPQVTLQADPLTGWFFTGFEPRPSQCGGRRTCLFRLDGPAPPLALTATFREIRENMIFGSSEAYPTTLGGLAAYDAECNRLASAAGLNDASGSAFIAAMSDATTSLRERLGTARGWMMMDGLPFADSQEALFDDGQILSTIIHDQEGGPSFSWMTGTEADGSSSDAHCNGWTSTSGEASGGISGGPKIWLAEERLPCDASYRILCMGRTRSIPVPVQVSAGKRIWESRTPYLPGSMAPDEKCQGERPAGVATAVAFIRYTNRLASAVLDPEATYVRLDGIAIGTGAELATSTIRTGPWLNADGLAGEPGDRIWTGAPLPNSATGANCQDWTTSSTAEAGFAAPHGRSSLSALSSVPCSEAHRIYCVEP